MKLFRRPSQKSEEEYNEMRKKVQDMNLSKKEEWMIILIAIKTFLPYVILTFFVIWSGIILIYFLTK